MWWVGLVDLRRSGAVPALAGAGLGSGGEDEGAFEVHGDAGEDQVGLISSQGEVSGPAFAVVVFQHGKDGFDPATDVGDGAVAPRGPRREFVMLVAPAADAVLDAERLQAGAASVAVIGLVRPHLPLVAKYQIVGRHGVVDAGRRHQHAPDQAGAPVDGDMHLIA